MKTIGILGGMSSVSSGEYYRLLNEAVQVRRGGHASAEAILYSVDFAVIEQSLWAQDWDGAARYLSVRAQLLERAGAEMVLLASNSMHRVAEDIEAAITVPFVHVVDVVADAALEAGAECVGLLGGGSIARGSFYRERLARHGLSTLVPSEHEQTEADRVIFTELTHGRFLDVSRDLYVDIANGLVRAGADAVVLACSEISMLLDSSHVPGVLLLDTTALHVQRAAAFSLGGDIA